MTNGAGTAVVGMVPVKAFGAAKGRLAEVLAGESRATLAQHLAARVVGAFGCPVAVACDDDQVAEWARGLGAEVLWVPDTDLNGAVTQGVALLAEQGVERVIVCHGDLPYPRRLKALEQGSGFTLVPDRVGDGTNVMALPAAVPFVFSYGVGSFVRHLAAAQASGQPVQVRYDQQLSIDIDHPVDLAILAADPQLALLAPPPGGGDKGERP